MRGMNLRKIDRARDGALQMCSRALQLLYHDIVGERFARGPVRQAGRSLGAVQQCPARFLRRPAGVQPRT